MAFSNPRINAYPCELMSSCKFADNFVNADYVTNNNGTQKPGSITINRGAQFDGTNYIEWDVVKQTGSFTVVVTFATTTLQTAALFCNCNMMTGDIPGWEDGFTVWLDDNGSIYGDYNNLVPGAPNPCSVEVDYADGNKHTVTYVVDTDNNRHQLFVDALDVETHASTISFSSIGSDPLTAGATYEATREFTGTIYSARIFDTAFTQGDHDAYHAGDIRDFMNMPFASWRCDDISDETDVILDRTTNANILYKADRSDTAAYPALQNDKYFFDRVDDYVSNLPEMPASYTVTAALSTPQRPYPYVVQSNDSSLLDDISSGGMHWGYVHSLIIYDHELSPIQLKHDEYQHLYWLYRGRAHGMYARLITDGTAKLLMLCDGFGAFTDLSGNGNNGFGIDVVRDGRNGVSFPASFTFIDVLHDTSLQLERGTILLYGDFSSGGSGTWLEKGTNYWFRYSTTFGLRMHAAAYAYTLDANDTHVAVSFVDGEAPKFYVNGEFVGVGTSTASIDDTSTADLYIGNSDSGFDRSRQALKHVIICDSVLTDTEIKAVYQSAIMIGATEMEAGQRVEYKQTYNGTTVNLDVDPGGPFQLIDVAFKFNTAPTTSEDMTVKTIDGDTDEYVEHDKSVDPSTGSLTSGVIDVNKRFADGRTIGVDYANTDARTIDVVVTYQLDESIT